MWNDAGNRLGNIIRVGFRASHERMAQTAQTQSPSSPRGELT